jgi:adenylylsulfate kinase
MTGAVAWFTGLPSSGKTTLAHAVAGELRLRDIHAVLLDSDELRALLPQLGYDEASRNHFYGLLARLAALIARQGHVVLVPATAHRRAYRDAARGLAPAFLEIFVDTPLEECRRRDT